MLIRNLGTLQAKLVADTKQLAKDLKKGEKEFKAFGKDVPKWLKPASLALVGIGTVAVTGIALAVRHFGNFEKSMKNVQAVSGATAQEFETLKDFAIKMGSTTAFTAKEAGDAMYFLASAGLAVDEQMKTTAAVLDLAAATQTELAESARIVVNTLSGFSLEAEESRRVADVFAKAIATSQANMSKLGAGMPVVSATMNDLGISLEATVTGLSLLFDKGISAERAATGLRNAMKLLIDPSNEAQEEIARLGLTVEELDPRTKDLADIIQTLGDASFDTASSIKIFGLENDAMNLLVATGAEKFREFESSLRGAAGAAEEMKDVQLDSLNGSITLLKSAVDGFVISFGAEFAPIIRKGADALTSLVTQFNNLDDSTKAVLAWTVAIGGVGAGLIGAVGLLGTVIPAVVAGFTALAPLLAVGAPLLVGIAAVGAAIFIVTQNMKALNPEIVDFNAELRAMEIINDNTSSAVATLQEELARLKKLGIDTTDLAVQDLDISMHELNEEITDRGNLWDKFINKVTGAGDSVDLLILPTTNVNTLLGVLQKHAGDSAERIDELEKSVTNVKQPTEEAAAVTENYDTKLAKLPTTMDDFTKAFSTLATDTATNSQEIIRDTGEATTMVIEAWGEIPIAAKESTEKTLNITKDHLGDMRSERDRAALDELTTETETKEKVINIQQTGFTTISKNRHDNLDDIRAVHASGIKSDEVFTDQTIKAADTRAEREIQETIDIQEQRQLRIDNLTDFTTSLAGGFNNINRLHLDLIGAQGDYHETWLSNMADWATRIRNVLDGVITLWQDASSIIHGIAGVIGGGDGGIGFDLPSFGDGGGGGGGDFVGPPAPSGGDGGSALGTAAGLLPVVGFGLGMLDALNISPQELGPGATLPNQLRNTLVFLQGEQAVQRLEEDLAERFRAAELSQRVGLPTADVFADPEALEILIRIANTLENPQVATNPVTTAQLLQAVVDLILPELQESGVL